MSDGVGRLGEHRRGLGQQAGAGCTRRARRCQPTLLVISPNAAIEADYAAAGSIDSAAEVDYFKLVLNQTFNTVTIMTSGPTDTAGQVETAQRVPVTTICDGERPEAEPPCVWGADADISTPDPDRSATTSASRGRTMRPALTNSPSKPQTSRVPLPRKTRSAITVTTDWPTSIASIPMTLQNGNWPIT